ncbi:MAG TPA: biotin/lipoyl-containing protein, partial [Stellaceae bacterium]|nr:biotin/lipoyl-containing protein [Stellaceae bacterium]
MPIQILMPALSPTMTEGSVARWLKKEGDEVHTGDIIAEIETDKATMEYEAVDEGRLGKIIVPEGAQGIKVNQPIAVLLEEGEDASAIGDIAAPPKPAETSPAAPQHAPPTTPTKAPSTPPPTVQAGNGHDTSRLFASPLARRMAAQ